MDGAQLSRFPHLSWLGFSCPVTPEMGTVCSNWHGTTHALDLVSRGHGSVCWSCRGHEIRHPATSGSIRFHPADGEFHTIHAQATEQSLVFTLFMPQGHLDAVAAEDHAPARVEYHRLLIQDDAVLQSCLIRIAKPASVPDAYSVAAQDEVARRLVLRLVELSGGGRPDWHDDASVFDRRTLGYLVECIDADLKIAPALSKLGVSVGLSPSHFAKKFRQSTGLSLHRFVNRRRIRGSLESLKDQSQPLGHVALELGFSSQSQFTRLFSVLTGMTPAKYRKQFRRMVG